MSRLSVISLVIGVVLMLVYTILVFAPRFALVWLKRFPRDKASARVLVAVDLIWGGWWIYLTPLGPVEHLKYLLFVLMPVAFFLLTKFADELLAPRALGGLMLLLPTPILLAARMHPSPYRYVLIVFSYVLVVKGIALVLSPHLFRKGGERIMHSTLSCRIWGIVGEGLAIFLIVLGLFVFNA